MRTVSGTSWWRLSPNRHLQLAASGASSTAGGFRLDRVRFREGSGSGGSGPRGPSYRWKTSGDAVIEAEASDRSLVERMLSGQEEAFVEFFDGHFPRLYRFAMARLNQDADAAEEVVQTVM